MGSRILFSLVEARFFRAFFVSEVFTYSIMVVSYGWPNYNSVICSKPSIAVTVERKELQEAMNAIEILGGKLEKVEEYDVNDDETRVLIFIRKIKDTKPLYPRMFGKIKNNPL